VAARWECDHAILGGLHHEYSLAVRDRVIADYKLIASNSAVRRMSVTRRRSGANISDARDRINFALVLGRSIIG
jgi:predicted DNA-binding protein (UPF0251 family)